MRILFFLCIFISTGLHAEDSAFSINVFEKEADQEFIDQTIKQFMQNYTIPGLSIALAKDEEILFAKGYGYADVDNKVAINITHRFRVASLSKPITAVAMMTLLEQGKLTLDDKVFGRDSILNSEFPVKDELFHQITIRHLLEHTAGQEWTNDHNAPMFQKPGLSQTALISWVLKNRRLSKAPGSEYVYSNFGYCLLGRVIEKISGMSYEHYVSKYVFKPAAAKSFAIGKRKLANTAFEVRYYRNTDEDPYWFPVARMDAHGGWIANALDVVKFLINVDGRGKDIINQQTVKLMTTPSEHNSQYALGWNVNQYNNWWHVGSLPGTAAIMVRTEQGYNWAILLNKRSEDKQFFSDLDQLGWKLVRGIKALNN